MCVQEEPSSPLTGRRFEARDRGGLFYGETVISSVWDFPVQRVWLSVGMEGGQRRGPNVC